ncbi:MAG TPA: branched-chain amino acid ABC transporter permease, partial [Casimicrobiaceae bacterium]
MDWSITALLTQDGITNGAIYALLALALVLVFAVTRVIFVPSGELVAYGTLTLAGLQLDKPPGTVHLLVAMAFIAGAIEVVIAIRRGEIGTIPRRVALWSGIPCAIAALVWWCAPLALALPLQVALTLAAVAALGPLLYRIAYQPLAEASVLVLLIVSVAVHFALTGLGLWFFGAEGSRTPAFASATLQLGTVNINAQSLLVVVTSAALIGVLYLFFGRTLLGKALHATAVNRIGARLVG